MELIDFLDDVLEIQDEDPENSNMINGNAATNFQAASMTIDASVKIYSSRVDSVHAETYKVLGGLTMAAVEEADEEETAGGDAEQTEEANQKKKRKAERGVNTIETNPDNLNAKILDLEFSVDPLFRKTSAAFDEKGVKGLLLNNLSVHRNCEIIFDSSDAVGQTAQVPTLAQQDVDMTSLQKMLNTIAANLTKAQICPTFADFKFSDDVVELGAVEIDPSILAEVQKDIQRTDDKVMIDDQEIQVDMPEMDHQDHEPDEIELQEAQLNQEMQAMEFPLAKGFDDGEGQEAFELGSQLNQEYNYFDTSKFQNWAGPAHWKFKPQKSMLHHLNIT